MAKIIYRLKVTVKVVAKDATYDVEFAEKILSYKAWELDRNNDTCMDAERKTGKMRVRFYPDPDTMMFPEDIKRKMEYTMPIEKARELYKMLCESRNLWFALDTADNYSL